MRGRETRCGSESRLGWRNVPLGALLVLLLAVGVGLQPAHADGDRELRRSPIVRAVEKSRAAVVAIHTTKLVRQNLYGWELPPLRGKGIGSGVIFHPEGYVITNAHVIAQASEVLVDVTAKDGSTATHDARIFAVDLPHDLAILRLLPPEGDTDDDPTYPYLELGRSDDLMVGETVIALGTPFNIGLTVTTGIIGALHRHLRGPAPPVDAERARLLGPREEEQVLDDFIQIDAAINPGNSGGPLLDVTGRWIGVNTAIWNRQETMAEGIGFAVPVDQVRALVGRAFKRRLIRGDWLGVELEPGPDGAATVRYVFPKGPARESGLAEGDVITSVGGKATPTLFDVRWQMAFLRHGAAVPLGVRQADGTRRSPITVHLLPVPTATLSDQHLGFEVADVSEKEHREQKYAFDAGVIVKRVRDGGPAKRIGLEPGDLLIGLGTYRIRHSDDLLMFLQYVQSGDLVKVRIVRSTILRSGRVLYDEKEGTLLAQ